MEIINVRLPRILFKNNVIYKLELNELRTFIYISTHLQLKLKIENIDMLEIFSKNTVRFKESKPRIDYLQNSYNLFLMSKEAHNNNMKIIMDKRALKTIKYPYYSIINNELVAYKYNLVDFKTKFNEEELIRKNNKENMIDYYTMPSNIVDLIMNNRLSPYMYKSLLHLIELDSITYDNGRSQSFILNDFLDKIHVDIKHIKRLTDALDDIIKNKYIPTFESYNISGKGKSKTIVFNLSKFNKKNVSINE